MQSAKGASTRRVRALATAAMVVMLVPAFFLLHRGLQSYPQLIYPPGPDQINYLNEAPDFENHLLVDPKAPLYTVWFGLFYSVNRDLRWQFYAERIASIFLLSVLVAFLGRRLFDLRTGLFLGFWTLNCKYLVLEPNGTNALAASMFVAAALCLTSKRENLRWPAAVFFLFLSSLSRPEMMVPLGLALVYLAWKAFGWFRSQRRKAGSLLPANWYHCSAILVIVSAITAFVKTHSNPVAPWSTSYAFFTAFAVNYIRRNNLFQQYPDAWLFTPQIIHKVMPNVTEPVSPLASPLRGIVQAWKLYPQECLYNTFYNVKVSIITLPAIALGWQSRILMFVATVVWVGSYFLVRGSNRENFKRTPATVWRDLLIQSVAGSSLIAVSIFFLVLWRYYLPLLPVMLIAAAYLVHRGLGFIPVRE